VVARSCLTFCIRPYIKTAAAQVQNMLSMSRVAKPKLPPQTQASTQASLKLHKDTLPQPPPTPSCLSVRRRRGRRLGSDSSGFSYSPNEMNAFPRIIIARGLPRGHLRFHTVVACLLRSSTDHLPHCSFWGAQLPACSFRRPNCVLPGP